MTAQDYQEKINREYEKENPDHGMISFWSDKKRALERIEAVEAMRLLDAQQSIFDWVQEENS